MRPNKLKSQGWSRKRFTPRAEQGEQVACVQEDLNSLNNLREEFVGKLVEGSGGPTERVTFFGLVGGDVRGWCYRNPRHQLSLSNNTGV